MKQATMVYRHPGKHKIGREMYDQKVVEAHAEEDEESELVTALADGWFATPDEARYGLDDTPPSREELEAKATELGISFRSNTHDDTLATKIADALTDPA